MEDVPVEALSNAPANHSATSQQPPFSDGADGEEAEQSELSLNLGRPIAPLICCDNTDDDDEDDQRGAFDYYTTPAVAAVEALGKPKVVSALQQQNNVAFDGTFKVDYDTASSNDSPRLDDVPSLDDAKRRFEEYEMGAIDHGVYEAHRASGRYKTIEDIHNAKTRASNDQQYDERFSVSSTDSIVHSDDESDDNLVNVNVHERLINRDTCYVPMGTDCGDDAMECINQAKTMTIQQPLNSYSSQNYGSTGVHSHAVDAAVSFGIQNRAADNATGFSRELSGASPANRVRIEKSTYSKRPSPPFGDPMCQKRLTQSVLQLVQNRVSHSSLEEPHSHKTDDATAAECSAAKKKKKKKKHSKGDEGEDARSQRDINGNPVGTTMTTTKKQHSSGKIIDSGSLEPHSRVDSGYEFSDMSQSQMSSSSDSRFLEKKAKKAKRGRKDACTTQAKDIPGNRGDDDVEALLNYIENGRKKQRPNGQVNGVPSLGATEQKSFPAKKPGCGKSERKVTEIDGKGQNIGSEGKASDVCTGSEESSVSDIVINMSSMLDTRTMKDALLVLPICSDTYIFTDFDCILPPKEAEFTEVKKKKKRAKDAANVVQRDAALHAFCQVEPHRKPHVSAHSVTPPPPTSSVGSDDAHVERALSPSSFPVLGRSREGRRNSTGNAPPVDGMQDDSDMESVKSVPIGSELSGRLDCGLSPSNFAKQSYAKIAAAQRPGKEGGALYRAEQMHLTGVDGHTAGVKYAKDVDRDKAVITSVERVETLGLQNTKQAAVAQSQYSCVQLAVSLPVLSSIDTSPLSDGVRTLVMPDVTITKKIACSTLTQMDAESTNQPLVCSQSSTHGVQLGGDPNSPTVSGLESCPRTRSEPSVCGDLRGGNIESKPCPIRSGGNDDQPHTGIPEFIATDVTRQSVCPWNAPSHAAAAVPPSNKEDVAKETQCSNKSLPHPPSSSGAAGGDVSVSIVNTNVDSSKMLSPQSNSGLTPATHACAPSSTGGCSRAAATASKTRYTIKRSKTTNKSVIFFDKKLNELPQNLGISFGFGPETISVNDITKSSDAHHGGSCNDACATRERESPMTDPVQQQQPPRDSSLSLVADTMPSLQTPGDDAADVYRTKVLVPVNGIILTHTASPHQGATPELPTSSTSYACPERVHVVSDSPTPLHTAKPDGRHGASPLYIRANDFNFQQGKFDVEGAIKFLYKEWEKVTRPKRTSRVTFYSDKQYN